MRIYFPPFVTLLINCPPNFCSINLPTVPISYKQHPIIYTTCDCLLSFTMLISNHTCVVYARYSFHLGITWYSTVCTYYIFIIPSSVWIISVLVGIYILSLRHTEGKILGHVVKDYMLNSVRNHQNVFGGGYTVCFPTSNAGGLPLPYVKSCCFLSSSLMVILVGVKWCGRNFVLIFIIMVMPNMSLAF